MSLPFDYLNPYYNRPDIYTEKSTLKPTRGIAEPGQSIISNLIIIIISSLIFITFFAWADVLRSYLDSLNVNEIIKNQTTSRLWFAILMSLFTCIAFSVLYYVYYEIKKQGHKDFLDSVFD